MYRFGQGNTTSRNSNVLFTVILASSTVSPVHCGSPCCADDFTRELVGCRVLIHHHTAVIWEIPRTVHHICKAAQNGNHRVWLPKSLPVAHWRPCSGLAQVASHVKDLHWKALTACIRRILHGKDFMDFAQDEAPRIFLHALEVDEAGTDRWRWRLRQIGILAVVDLIFATIFDFETMHTSIATRVANFAHMTQRREFQMAVISARCFDEIVEVHCSTTIAADFHPLTFCRESPSMVSLCLDSSASVDRRLHIILPRYQ